MLQSLSFLRMRMCIFYTLRGLHKRPVIGLLRHVVRWRRRHDARRRRRQDLLNVNTRGRFAPVHVVRQRSRLAALHGEGDHYVGVRLGKSGDHGLHEGDRACSDAEVFAPAELGGLNLAFVLLGGSVVTENKKI